MSQGTAIYVGGTVAVIFLLTQVPLEYSAHLDRRVLRAEVEEPCYRLAPSPLPPVWASDLETDVQRAIVGISIATGVLAVAASVFVLWVPQAPAPLRDRMIARFGRWNDIMERVLARGAYTWAVVMVVLLNSP